MARVNLSESLSIVIPCLNEANNLPLLLADLRRWPGPLEICICDGGSTDLTMFISELAGANCIQLTEANRGSQLHHGACKTQGDWILFLHADCRMQTDWPMVLESKINKTRSKNIAWFFDFRIQGKRLDFRILELFVAIRSSLFKRPYGDQGLLIHRELYRNIGGYRSLHIMEDLDLIERISKTNQIKRLGLPLYSSDRRWREISIFKKAWKNAQLRKKWRDGESTKDLSLYYYQEK